MARTRSRDRVVLAAVVAAAVAIGFATLPVAGAAGAQNTTLDGELGLAADDGGTNATLGLETELGASDDGTLDANLDARTDASDATASTDVDANASTDTDGTAVGVDADAGVNASTGTDGTAVGVDADAGANATVDAGETALDADLDGGASVDGDGVGVAANASLGSGSATAGPGGDDGSSSGETGSEERGSGDADGRGDDTGASSDDARDESGPVPVPEDPESGLALGSLLLGAGLLARQFTLGSIASTAAGSLLASSIGLLRAWGWRLVAAAGYQRWDDSDPLEHATRAAIRDRLADQPGACLTGLAEAVDVPLSTLRYHLRILEFEGVLATAEVRGKRRYFPAGDEPDDLGIALADDGPAAVLEALAREPDSVSGLADRLDRDPSTVSHHLQRLEKQELVERERDGRRVVNRLADGLAERLADARAPEAAGRVPGSAD